jgi:hypothetical protein
MATHDAKPNNFNQIATTADWEKLFTTIGVWDGIDGSVTTGMVPTLDASPARNINISTGTVIIKGQLWWCDASVKTAISAADPTYDRYDVLVIRLDRTFPTSVGTVAPYIITGTPAAAPAVPAIQQTTSGLYDIPVAQWRARSTGNGSVIDSLIDRRQFSGHSVVAMLSSARPAPAHPRLALETDTGYLQRWDGSVWRNIGPKNQVLQTGLTANTTGYANLHTPFQIPANDSALGPCSYRLRCGGHGVQAAGTARPFGLLVNAFGKIWGEIQDTGGISPGSNFNWYYSCELIVSATGQASFYGHFSVSHSVYNPAPSTSNQAVAGQLGNGGVVVNANQSMVLQGAWTSVAGAPVLTCYGATFDRVAN